MVVLKNSFHALPSMDEVGLAMGLHNDVPLTDIDSDFADDMEDHHDMLPSVSIALDSPSSSRQKKKAGKKTFSGNRPKGRHKR